MLTTTKHHKLPLLYILLLILVSCGGSKRVTSTSNSVEQITAYAKKFIDTPYRYGGTTHQGMDCSGLIYHTFLKHNKELPRTTNDMSKYGKKIKLKHARVGDLLFFKTSKKRGGINHVGLVTEVNGYYIEFIHSTTSRGVIVSKLNESYWSRAYKFTRRVL
jgi:cell wall-associated NlpC family hydrolase